LPGWESIPELLKRSTNGGGGGGGAIIFQEQQRNLPITSNVINVGSTNVHAQSASTVHILVLKIYFIRDLSFNYSYDSQIINFFEIYVWRVFTLSFIRKYPKSNVRNSFRPFAMADECVQRMHGLNPTAVEPHSTSASAASWQQLGSSSGAHAQSHNLDAFTPGKNKIKIVRKVVKLWYF
jgi:hypothetical protein